MSDVVVIGAGPAGRAVASRLAHREVQVTLVDPAPDQPWRATYGLWQDEVPPWLHRLTDGGEDGEDSESSGEDDENSVGHHDRPADGRRDAADAELAATRLPRTPVVGSDGSIRSLRRGYLILSNPALRAALASPGPDHVTEVPGRVTGLRDGQVTLADGTALQAGVIIDAAGASRHRGADTAGSTGGRPVAITRRRRTGPTAAQTAFGLVLPTGPGLLASTPLAFMDWRADHGEEGWPTFLYTVPLGQGRVLVEETSLARRPGLPLPILERRLRARLRRRGVVVPDGAEVERVAFPVDLPVAAGRGRLVTFGAASPLVHPATGYSLAASLKLADDVAETLAGHLATGGPDAAAAARRTIWSPGALAVHALRRRGLEVLLALPAEGVGEFFDLFFQLPAQHQRAYLSNRDDPVAVGAAMWAVFRAADGPLRRHLLRWGALPGRSVEST